MLSTVNKIDHQPNGHPNNKSQPGNQWQGKHQITADNYRTRTDKFVGRNLEFSDAIRLLHS